VVFFQPPSVPGFGSSAGFEAVLLDKSGGEYADLDKVTQQFIGKLMERPEIEFAQTSFNTKYPQYQMNINVPVAKVLEFRFLIFFLPCKVILEVFIPQILQNMENNLE
jgi:HAE1 family hydrophobic/amphiphilic exporter-1